MSEEFELWSKRYMPKTLDEVVGQDSVVKEVEAWVKNFKNEKNKAILLYGPTGSGKTALVYALSSDLNYELVETNASDFRTKELIEEKVGHAVQQISLLSKEKIILIDEVDGVHGTSDRGGLQAVYKIIGETSYPVILIANDPWKTNLRNLRNKCKLVQLKKVNIRAIVKKLKEICKAEGIEADDFVISEIARRAEGDLRAAINDLQSVAQGKKKISKEDLESLSVRDKQVSIFEILLAIFKSSNRETILKNFWNSDKSPDEILLWIAENIPKEYDKPEEIAKAYDLLSRADVFRGRIIHTQAWNLQSFSNELVSLGVSSAKKEKYHKFTKYMPPKILLKMGASRVARAKRDAVALQIGKMCHCSKKRAIEQFPYISLIIKKYLLGAEIDDKSSEYLKKYV